MKGVRLRNIFHIISISIFPDLNDETWRRKSRHPAMHPENSQKENVAKNEKQIVSCPGNNLIRQRKGSRTPEIFLNSKQPFILALNNPYTWGFMIPPTRDPNLPSSKDSKWWITWSWWGSQVVVGNGCPGNIGGFLSVEKHGIFKRFQQVSIVAP